MLPAKQASGPAVEAPTLVCPVPFSTRYDLDRQTGIFSRAGHPLRGESIAGRILVWPAVQGGVAAGWDFLAMQGRRVGAAGLVFGSTNPAMVQGAIAAGIPIMAGVDEDLFICLRSGVRLRLNPAAHEITVLDEQQYYPLETDR